MVTENDRYTSMIDNARFGRQKQKREREREKKASTIYITSILRSLVTRAYKE